MPPTEQFTPDELIHATRSGDIKSVEYLLEHGVDPDAKNERGDTALTWAAFAQFDNIVRLLLNKGARIDEKDGQGNTALILAANRGCASIVRLLLDRGASIDDKNFIGMDAKYYAEVKKFDEVTRMLNDAPAQRIQQQKNREEKVLQQMELLKEKSRRNPVRLRRDPPCP